MISVFPQPIEGESYASLLNRLGRRAYAQGIKPLCRERSDAPKRLMCPEEFVGSLAVPAWMSLEDLLENHTLLPIIRPFMDPDEAERLRSRLARGCDYRLVTSLLSDLERHCPDCRRAEFDSLGEAGVQSVHQLRWITRCQIHQCLLSDGRDLSADVFPNELLACAPTLSRPDVTLLNGIQKSTVWLARAKVPALGRKPWRSFHRKALSQRFAIYPPYPRSELHKVARLVSKRLTRLLWLPMLSSQDNWLETAVHRPNGIPHPLHHIVLLRLCGETAATAVTKIQSRGTMGANYTKAQQLTLPFE